jgi:hypothetical protein
MTDYKHPITPPPELVRKWNEEAATAPMADQRYIATQAARWGADQQLQLDAEQINRAWQKGADQELEACCEWIGSEGLAGYTSRELRAARRPNPPSLKEQALKALQRSRERWRPIPDDCDIIRQALEQLND